MHSCIPLGDDFGTVRWTVRRSCLWKYPLDEPWMLTDVAERINAFPTHTLKHFPFNEPYKFQFSLTRCWNGPTQFFIILPYSPGKSSLWTGFHKKFTWAEWPIGGAVFAISCIRYKNIEKRENSCLQSGRLVLKYNRWRLEFNHFHQDMS